MNNLNEKQQKTYLKISNLIKKHSKLVKYEEDNLKYSLRLPEKFYKKHLTLDEFGNSIMSSIVSTLIIFIVYLLLHLIFKQFSKGPFPIVKENVKLIGFLIFILSCVVINIQTYLTNKLPYKLSKQFANDVFNDEDLKKIIFEKPDTNSMLIIDELPENKKVDLSALRKLNSFLVLDNFYEKIGVKEDIKLKEALDEYKKIKSKIQEYDATDTHKYYWREKLNEFIEENNQYKKHFN